MAKRSAKLTTTRSTRGSARRLDRGLLMQFLLVALAGTLLIGSVVAMKVFSQRDGWRDWSMGMRKGMLGNRAGRDAQGDNAAGLAEQSIEYLGGGHADLGEFYVRQFDTITGTTLTVSFLLKGITPCNDAATFNEFMLENQRSFRQRVSEAVRDCPVTDFDDQRKISKKVRTRVNRAFGHRFLESATLEGLLITESIGSYESEEWRTGAEEEVAVSTGR